MSYRVACSQAFSKPVWHMLLLCVQWKTPHDGQRNCPKYVEFYSKNKFDKLVHLVVFIIRIYHDLRPPVRQIYRLLLSETCILFQKFLVLLKHPDGHSLLVALIPPSHWAALNTQRSSGGCTGKARRIKVRRSCRPVDWTSMFCSLSI